MKLIIAGGRAHWLTVDGFKKLDALHQVHPVSEVVCGGAPGADACGKVWAILNGIPVKDYRPHWRPRPPAFGITRNLDMAEYADALAVFPGRKGTIHMVEVATLAGLMIFDYRAAPGEPQPKSLPLSPPTQ